MKIAENMTPSNLHRTANVTEEDHFARAQLQEMLNLRFMQGRDVAPARSHAQDGRYVFTGGPRSDKMNNNDDRYRHFR